MIKAFIAAATEIKAAIKIKTEISLDSLAEAKSINVEYFEKFCQLSKPNMARLERMKTKEEMKMEASMALLIVFLAFFISSSGSVMTSNPVYEYMESMAE